MQRDLRFRELKRPLSFSDLFFLSILALANLWTFCDVHNSLVCYPNSSTYQTEFLFETFPVAIRKDILMMVDGLIPALFQANYGVREALGGSSKPCM